MTGPDHYRQAEELTTKAREYLGKGYDQNHENHAALYAAVAQVHTTLALAAATALGTRRADSIAWGDVAGTNFVSGS
jgi:hypothetical protein